MTGKRTQVNEAQELTQSFPEESLLSPYNRSFRDFSLWHSNFISLIYHKCRIISLDMLVFERGFFHPPPVIIEVMLSINRVCSLQVVSNCDASLKACATHLCRKVGMKSLSFDEGGNCDSTENVPSSLEFDVRLFGDNRLTTSIFEFALRRLFILQAITF